MHPLALGAFCRRGDDDGRPRARHRLNAPFGVRCFLSSKWLQRVKDQNLRLNARFGARCFLT